MSTDATKQNKKGFSLIELIVSVALFTVILTASLGSLIVIIDVNRQTKAIKLVVNNLNLAMEGMSRDLRVGSNICRSASGTGAACRTIATDGDQQLFFTTDAGETGSSFRLNANSIERRIGTGGDYLALTGSDVIVDDMRFFIRGIGLTDNVQPSVVIMLTGHIRQADQEVEFNIQTTVSQRKLEL